MRPRSLFAVTGDVCPELARARVTFALPIRDRLAGRTLVSESRNAGSTPAPGTKWGALRRSPPMLSENLALNYAGPPALCGWAIHSSEAEWSGSRLLTGISKVRFLPLELSRTRASTLWSALLRAACQPSAALPARVNPRAIVPMLLDGRGPVSYTASLRFESGRGLSFRPLE